MYVIMGNTQKQTAGNILTTGCQKDFLVLLDHPDKSKGLEDYGVSSVFIANIISCA